MRFTQACARSRPKRPKVDRSVDAFMDAANRVFPGVCVHFEDWKSDDAVRLLKR